MGRRRGGPLPCPPSGNAPVLTLPIVQLDGVAVTYPGGVAALRPTTLSIAPGAFTVLLGPSGAGKSTLLRVINLLAAPSAGTIAVAGLGTLAIDGRIKAAALRDHRRRTAIIFQSHQLIGRHTALRNVLLGRLPFHSTWRSLLPLPRADVAQALHCLDRVGLADKALQRADRLSGGQQQRVGIARALAQLPRLLLAVEPVASLDPATAEDVLSQLKQVCADDGIAAVVSLHQLGFARRFADRIVGLSQGRVVFDGSPDSLTEAGIEAIYGRGGDAVAGPLRRVAGQASRHPQPAALEV
jgi:phosphonate transport system ATP-binding protein